LVKARVNQRKNNEKWNNPRNPNGKNGKPIIKTLVIRKEE